MISKNLIRVIKAQYRLDWHGIHGLHHWARVYSNGLHLAKTTGANIQVVALFSVFHDAGRANDGRDQKHGLRGANLALQFHGEYFELTGPDLELLRIACTYHTTASTHDDVTVQTCFDADRLDLARVGNMPDSKYLCTDSAKNPYTINWANERSLKNHVPSVTTTWE